MDGPAQCKKVTINHCFVFLPAENVHVINVSLLDNESGNTYYSLDGSRAKRNSIDLGLCWDFKTRGLREKRRCLPIVLPVETPYVASHGRFRQ